LRLTEQQHRHRDGHKNMPPGSRLPGYSWTTVQRLDYSVPPKSQRLFDCNLRQLTPLLLLLLLLL